MRYGLQEWCWKSNAPISHWGKPEDLWEDVWDWDPLQLNLLEFNGLPRISCKTVGNLLEEGRKKGRKTCWDVLLLVSICDHMGGHWKLLLWKFWLTTVGSSGQEVVIAKSNSQEALLGDVDWKHPWVFLIESWVQGSSAWRAFWGRMLFVLCKYA